MKSRNQELKTVASAIKWTSYVGMLEPVMVLASVISTGNGNNDTFEACATSFVCSAAAYLFSLIAETLANIAGDIEKSTKWTSIGNNNQ